MFSPGLRFGYTKVTVLCNLKTSMVTDLEGPVTEVTVFDNIEDFCMY
jgi:hypothetical protein